MGLLRVGLLASVLVGAAVGCTAQVSDDRAAPSSAPGTSPASACASTYQVADVGEPIGPTSPVVEIRPVPRGQAHDDRFRKLRAPLSARDHAAALRAAGLVRPVLERLCASGDFGPDATRGAFTDAGYPANDVYVQPFPATPEGTTPPGVAYNLHLGDRACVAGHVRPGQVRIAVDGATRDGSCAETP